MGIEMKKIGRNAGIALFLAALYIVPVCFATGADREFSENENRYLEQRPELSAEAVVSGEYMKAAEKYISDQFPARDRWISAKSDLMRLTGAKEVNGVYLGEEGYLIEKWLPQEIDMEQLEENITVLNTYAKMYPKQKISVMIVPTAGAILHEKMPENAPYIKQDRLMEFVERELCDIEWVNIKTILEKDAEEGIFYKTDHHWTTYGAFLAYGEWKKSRGGEVREEQFEIERVAESFQGSLYSRVLGSGCAEDTVELYRRKEEVPYTVSYQYGKDVCNSVYAMGNLRKKDKYQVFLNGNHPELTIRSQNRNGKHLLVFKDSFANAWIPFAVNDFESIHVIDPRYFNGNIEEYITENGITESLFLYNIKNFCEDKRLAKLF